MNPFKCTYPRKVSWGLVHVSDGKVDNEVMERNELSLKVSEPLPVVIISATRPKD